MMIDHDKITEMITLVGAETVANLIATYQQTTDETLVHLGVALENSDSEQVRFHAHSLKGASGTLGVISVYGLCKALEDQAKAGELAEGRHALDRVSEAYHIALAELKALVTAE